MRLHRLDHVAIAVTDMERSLRWYEEVLGFRRRYQDTWGGEPVFVVGGDFGLALFRGEGMGATHAPAARVLHIAFGTDRPGFLAARHELEGRGIAVRFADHEVSHSIYFRDPDGHELEITTYDVGT